MVRRMVYLTALSLCLLHLPVALNQQLQGQEQASAPLRVRRTFSSDERDTACNTHQFSFSPEVVADAKDGSVRLAHSVLVADERGATDHFQGESLSERTWARKVFQLDSADVSAAELFLFGSAKQIRVNGTLLEKSQPLTSSGWSRAQVPPGLLRAGANEVILAGGGGLLVEPGRQPGRSFKSSDGGQTWSSQALGSKNPQPGEYLVRLRLALYAPRGWIRSGVIDLWTDRPEEVARPGKLVSIQSLAKLQHGQPEGTALIPWLRTGSTPEPTEKTWTGWVRLDRDHRPEGGAAEHRWAQLRFDLATSKAQVTPRLPRRFELIFDRQPDRLATADRLVVDRPTRTHGPSFAPSSVPFVYQEPSARLKLLRERYQLDRVIAAGATEMEQLMLLRYWVRNQWHTAWGSHPAAWMPPWDALIILESKDQPDCLTMCTHYAAVYVQCCLALGWNARHCILDHHCVSEVWVDQHRKWVMMDPGNSAQRADVGLHFEKQGLPLSARELHLAERTKQTEGITVCFTPARLVEKVAPLCRPAPPVKGKPPAPRPDTVPLAELPQYPVCQLNNYRRYAFPARNNYLTSLYPGELYQGWSHYFYDGYCWVGDDRDDPQRTPEYSWQLPPARPQDIDWSLNCVRIHLARTAQAGDLRVDLETRTPNLAHFEMSDGSETTTWQRTPASFDWKLTPGKNVLRVRSVNQFGRVGEESRVEVKRSSG